MQTSVLPHLLSGLLETAIEDSRSLSRKVYHPHFSEWHSMNPQGKCEICLGGSILAGTCGYEPDHQVIAQRLDFELQRKIDALNSMRTGNWSYAFEIINHHPPGQELLDELHALPVPAYAEFVGWRQFIAHLKSLEAIVPRLREIENKFPLDASLH